MAEATQGHLGANDTGDVGPRSPGAGGSVLPFTPPPSGVSNSRAVLQSKDFARQLEETELLINYAAESGIAIDGELRHDVLSAKVAIESEWTVEMAARLLTAQTKLTVLLAPVSGESLRKCAHNEEASATLRTHRWMAILLGLLIVPFSIAAFVAAATCETIRKDIEIANGLAVSLAEKISVSAAAPSSAQDLMPAEPQALPESDLKELQQFAAKIRDIRARARRLGSFGRHAWSEADNARFELPPAISDFKATAANAIQSYQNVRYLAQSVQETVSTTFGALTACILPALYALLGACAYLIRSFETQIKARTFTGIERPTAHFLIAGIGGFVVGLFGDFGLGQSAVLPPLALAFLVGYGVDMFFFVLDRLVQTFGRSQTTVVAERTTKNTPQ